MKKGVLVSAAMRTLGWPCLQNSNVARVKTSTSNKKYSLASCDSSYPFDNAYMYDGDRKDNETKIDS